MNHLLLPHEIGIEAQNWNIMYFEVFKVAHENFIWNGSGIPHMGRYGGHLWQVLVQVWMHE